MTTDFRWLMSLSLILSARSIPHSLMIVFCLFFIVVVANPPNRFIIISVFPPPFHFELRVFVSLVFDLLVFFWAETNISDFFEKMLVCVCVCAIAARSRV
jgi:hypothetical protein